MSYRSDIVQGILEKFPKHTTSNIAKMLCKEYPLDFNTYESARSRVRYYRGEYKREKPNIVMGERTEEEKRSAYAWNKLPESDYSEQKAFKIPTGNNRILILSDIHLPYHDEQALSLALEWGYNKKPNAIILNGDTIDMYQASRFIKDRRLRDLSGELDMTRNFLKQLKEEFNCPIYFKIGNHEDRWENYLKTSAPELLGIADFELKNVLRFGELGITEIKSKQIIKVGKLSLLHGHEMHTIFSPVNAARGLYMRTKVSSMAGHNHQTSEHSENDLHGNVVTCWSIGCLCGLRPDYMPVNRWNHGFAYVETEPSGDFVVQNLRIIEGKVR
jgi:predicted phosphodiesterase